ncbi:hypothetical protein B0H15DRAFT_374408 [Mycena belliarum]|uniref:HNH nuclease domain-containing protein n=1 Tax=Mycena belliarum TaxID=1033014 RepID=A0AAD6U5C3_9AGAR|nr:hypothetical protein B0H15DRAFT_374408 [Mycena belliae]
MATRQPLPPLPAVSFDPLSDYLIVLNGYTQDILIRLPCFPQNPEDAASFKGIVAYIVFDACVVLTNNCTPESGSLLQYQGARMPVVRTNRPKGKGKASVVDDTEDNGPDGEGENQKRWRTTQPAHMVSLIWPGVYRFFQDADDKRAKVDVSSFFSEWELPSVIPLHWRRANQLIVEQAVEMSQVSQRVKDEDPECPLTQQTSGRESCHLIPEAEDFWYDRNALAARTGDPQPNVNSPNNIMSLRADLTGLDDFVFVPALSQLELNPYTYDEHQAALDPPFMVFFLDVHSLDLAHSHHMRELVLPKRIPAEYLYARFAYNVFLAARRRASPDAPPPSKKAKHAHADLDLNPAWRSEFRLLKMEQYDRMLMDPKVPRPILQNAQHNGIEPGFSRALRVAYNWRQAHPVELGSATVGHVGEEDRINEGLEWD